MARMLGWTGCHGWLHLGRVLALMALLTAIAAGTVWGTERLQPTPLSMDFYGYIAGAKAGDRLTVHDPRGVLCGEFTLNRDGQYGFLPVYGDDPATTAADGARQGDVLTFRLNGVPLQPAQPILWRGDREQQRVDFP